MKSILITAYPFAMQYGRIDIPDDITDPEEARTYIINNWDDIDFDEPDLDYEGCGSTFDMDVQ